MSGMVEIGVGRLNWPSGERVSDRYGLVGLWDESGQAVALAHLPRLGAVGQLIVEVIKTRESQHIGDLFRGFSPSIPAVGDVIFLGRGKFVSECVEGCGKCVGVQPLQRRDSDWLNPVQLYRAHDQTVRLYWRQDNGEA